MIADGKLNKRTDDLPPRHQIEEQRRTNETALPYSAEYAGHREAVMRQLLEEAGDGQRSLCLLGAGNCYDVDLERLVAHFARVHLVDLDSSAVERAVSHLASELSERVITHAPVDLTGMLARLPAWSRFQLTAETLMSHPQTAARSITARVGGPFDVVASTCVLTQLQLAVLAALGEQHRLFQAVRHTLTVTHLRTLAELTRPGGKALLVTDLVSADKLKLPGDPSGEQLRQGFDEAVEQGNVIYVAHPELLRLTVNDDPNLKRQLGSGEIKDVWLWQQGPKRQFLTYALAFDRHEQDKRAKSMEEKI